MVGILVNSVYKYENVTLASGAKVTAHSVTIQKDEVVRVENGNVTLDNNNTFSFSIYNYGMDGKKTYNLNSVPENVDGQAIVKEFVDFVEADVA
jgi:hypothetical protein